jgi:aryl-alcohol dehydrogenase-like predicted oxidoreductase
LNTLRLGRSGLRVSEVGLGAWTFGRETSESDAFAMLDRFVELGGSLIDTADAYNAGGSEEIIGRWLQSRRARDEVVLATKVFFPTGVRANDVGLSRKHILSAVEGSLSRLGTDYIDLYQIHCRDAGVPVEESLSALDDIVHDGKARYLGVSNYTGWQLIQAVLMSMASGCNHFASVQNEYNLLSRSSEWEVFPAAREAGMAVLPWSPLGGGWLTGKYRRGTDGPIVGTRVAETALEWQPDSWEQRGNERTWAVVDAVSEIAQNRGVPPGQVALNWLRAKPGVVSPLLGARTLQQLESNLGCLEWVLNPIEVASLDKVSAPDAPYPYSFVAQVESMHGRSLD